MTKQQRKDLEKIYNTYSREQLIQEVLNFSDSLNESREKVRKCYALLNQDKITNPIKRNWRGWSPLYSRILELRRDYDHLLRKYEKLKRRVK